MPNKQPVRSKKPEDGGSISPEISVNSYNTRPYLSIYPSDILTIYLSIYLSICQSIYSPLFDLDRFFSFLIFCTLGRTPWTEDQPIARPLPAHREAQTQNKPTRISMAHVEFEPTIPVFERAKTVRASDRASTVVGCNKVLNPRIQYPSK
jgi:hypothetical protein